MSDEATDAGPVESVETTVETTVHRKSMSNLQAGLVGFGVGTVVLGTAGYLTWHFWLKNRTITRIQAEIVNQGVAFFGQVPEEVRMILGPIAGPLIDSTAANMKPILERIIPG